MLGLAPGLWCSAAGAEEEEEPRKVLAHDLRIDIPVTAGLATGLVVWAVVKDDVLSKSCTICDRSLVGIDESLRTGIARRDPTPADNLSKIGTYGIAPALALGLTGLAANTEHRLDETPLDALVIAEATVSALTIDAGLGLFIRRERPGVHFGDPDQKQARLDAGNSLDSFPSGHTTATFAMAASAGTVATMRGYRLAPLVWLGTGALAITTGYLRMAADRAYFTDAITGAAIGTAVGILVPYLFHSPRQPQWLQNTSISVGDRTLTIGRLF